MLIIVFTPNGYYCALNVNVIIALTPKNNSFQLATFFSHLYSIEMGGGGRGKYMDSTVSRRKAQTLRVNNSCLYYQNTSTHHDISIINTSNHRLSSYTATPVEAQPQPLAGQARCVAHALSAISISGLLGGIGIGPGTVGFFFSLSLSSPPLPQTPSLPVV